MFSVIPWASSPGKAHMFRNAEHNATRGFTESISILRGPHNLIQKKKYIILRSQCSITKEVGEWDQMQKTAISEKEYSTENYFCCFKKKKKKRREGWNGAWGGEGARFYH